MANKTLKSRLVIRHDTKENWLLANPTLLNGEMGIEIDGSKYNIKFGDGSTAWQDLPYAYNLDQILAQIPQGGAVYKLTKMSLEEADSVQLATVDSPENGDVAVVTTLVEGTTYQVSSYIYNGTDWVAITGEVDASKVILNKDLTITANIGVQTIGASGSKTLQTKGKNVQQVLDMIVAQEKNPSITQPSTSITLTGAGAKEVGTEYTPKYSVGFNAGNYQYGPATGVTATAYAVTDTNSGSASTQTGSFTAFTVADNTNYRVNVTTTHSAGAVPKTNLGNDYAAGQIQTGTKTAQSAAVTGYRAWFNYVGGNTEAVDGTWIRTNATNKNASGYASFSLSIADGTKRVVVAIPKSKNQKLKSVIDVDGMGLDVKGNFVASVVQVEGLNNYTAVDYDVWTFTNANGVSKTTYNFTFGA